LLVVDDHALVRAGLRALLKDDPAIEIAAEAANAREALQRLAEQAFDVILLDVTLPDGTGWDLLEGIRRSPARATPVLMLSAHDDREYGLLALRAGAAGYLCKSQDATVVAGAIRRVAAGGRYVSEGLAERLAGLAVDGIESCQAHERLSPRELQVLSRLAAGQSLISIATRLHVSPKTVTSWRTRLLRKLGCRSNAALTRYAVRHGLIDA
jgi:DNA-binding NarL/FixJ family response regulator